jgi:hypothetical protein
MTEEPKTEEAKAEEPKAEVTILSKEITQAKVSGQVAATNTEPVVEGFPSDAEMGKTLYPKKGNVNLMGEGTDALPATEEGQVIKVNFRHGSWGFMKRKDQYVLETSEGQPYAGGLNFEGECFPKDCCIY